MTFGLVHASYSLPEWQAVKLTFFAPWLKDTFNFFFGGGGGDFNRRFIVKKRWHYTATCKESSGQ